MQSSFFRLTYFLFFVVLLTPLRAELKLPALFSDHMVLQQGL
jgi:hypothetical protein